MPRAADTLYQSVVPGRVCDGSGLKAPGAHSTRLDETIRIADYSFTDFGIGARGGGYFARSTCHFFTSSGLPVAE
jgi:hypothetical protein